MKKKFWLTLIEVLIAITVFAIGVLAVLRVLTWNLSVLDYTNTKLQSTVLAKEWLELLYNLRDSNLEKDLPRNCILNQEIYWLNTVELEKKLLYVWGEPANYICSDYFAPNKILQIAFNKDHYISYKNLSAESDFEALFEKNQLCLYSWDNIVWYAYCDGNKWERTIFARYLSFSAVDVTENKSLISNDSNIDTNSDKLSADKILKVESHVLFQKLWKTWDIVFESFIWNY